MLYDAFVSYSHAADGKLAPALQRALHDFTKPWYKRRALRVFRDKTSLSANPALWPAIEQALTESKWLLFLASPQAARSVWVHKEIQWWLEHRTSATMLILLTEGDLAWNSQAQDFDWGCTDAVPQCLQGKFRDEPLYVDLRWAKTEERLSLRHSQFRGAILDIAAPLHNKPKDELDGDDVRQHRKNKTWAWSAVLLLLLLSILAARASVIAGRERDNAILQRDRAQSRFLRMEAQRLSTADPLWDAATLLSIESLRKTADSNSYELLHALVNARARPVARFVTKDGGFPLAFSHDGEQVATKDGDSIVVFRARSGQEIQRIPFEDFPRFSRLAAGSSSAWLSREGHLLATQEEHRFLNIRDLDDDLDVARISFLDSVGVLEWSQDGELLAAGTGERDGSTSVFQVGSWRRLARLKHQGSVKIDAIAISPKGDLVASSANRTVMVFEPHQHRPLVDVSAAGRLARIAVSPDGSVAGGVLARNTVILYEAGTSRQIARVENCTHARDLTFSSDGRSAAVGCQDGLARILDIATGKIVAEAPYRYNHRMALSQDGALLFTVTPEGAAVLELPTGREIRTIGGDAVNAVAFSPTGKQMAVARSRGVDLFELQDQQEPRKLNDEELIESVAFSPDGKLVAVGARNRIVTIYDTSTGQPDAPWNHKEEETEVLRIRMLTFSADGELLASVAENPTSSEPERRVSLRVFDIRSDREIIRVAQNEAPLMLRFSDDKGFLEMAVGKQRLRLERLPLRAQDLIDEACLRVGRNLTPAEWSLYLEDSPYRATCPTLNPAAMEISE